MAHHLRRRSIRRTLTVVGVAAALALAGCGADDDASASDQQRPPAAAEAPSLVEVAEGRTIIDVRTPEEHAAGHVEGAVNIDVQDPSFDDRVAELPTDGSYLVYCRSGNRSAAAAARMADLGFTDVVDGGAFEALVAAGLPAA